MQKIKNRGRNFDFEGKNEIILLPGGAGRLWTVDRLVVGPTQNDSNKEQVFFSFSLEQQ